MPVEVKLPDLGEDAGDKAEVSFWYVEEGEQIEEGQDMVDMITDKAAFTVPAPVSGLLKEIRAQEGETVQVGEVMAIVEA
jgi:pyruvate/2-oxoglutarate dehydrogenase complex dihydrolipoamide acyltransferase (E2) component